MYAQQGRCTIAAQPAESPCALLWPTRLHHFRAQSPNLLLDEGFNVKVTGESSSGWLLF